MDEAQFGRFIAQLGRTRTRRPADFESGDGVEWITWRRNFETICAINHWEGGANADERQARRTRAKREARASIRGKADQTVSDIQPADDAETTEAFLDRLQARFLPQAAANFAKAAFDTATLLPTESLLDWQGRVRHLFCRAYPDLAAEANGNDLLIRRYILGLINVTIKTQTLRGNPDTLDRALELAQNEASVDAQVGGVSNMGAKITAMGVSDGTDTPSTTRATQALRRNGGNLFPSSSILTNEQQTCWICSSPDHFMASCPRNTGTAQRSVRQSRGRGRGRGRGGRGGARGRGSGGSGGTSRSSSQSRPTRSSGNRVRFNAITGSGSDAAEYVDGVDALAQELDSALGPNQD